MTVIARIEKAEAYLDNLADVIEDTLGDDSVNWSHELRSVAVELRAAVMALGQQQAGEIEALESVVSYAYGASGATGDDAGHLTAVGMMAKEALTAIQGSKP